MVSAAARSAALPQTLGTSVPGGLRRLASHHRCILPDGASARPAALKRGLGTSVPGTSLRLASHRRCIRQLGIGASARATSLSSRLGTSIPGANLRFVFMAAASFRGEAAIIFVAEFGKRAGL